MSVNEKKCLVMHMHVQLKLDEQTNCTCCQEGTVLTVVMWCSGWGMS